MYYLELRGLETNAVLRIHHVFRLTEALILVKLLWKMKNLKVFWGRVPRIECVLLDTTVHVFMISQVPALLSAEVTHLCS